jgi:hypothetical protein
MTQCITQLTLGSFGQKPVVIDFDAPEVDPPPVVDPVSMSGLEPGQLWLYLASIPSI